MSIRMDVPEVVWHQVITFLPAPDVLNLISTCRSMCSLGQQQKKQRATGSCSTKCTLWSTLVQSQFAGELDCHVSSRSADPRDDNMHDGTNDNVDYWKNLYLQLAYRQALPAVEWKSMNSFRASIGANVPSAREGHLSCILGKRYWVITGGFTDDSLVHVKDLRSTDGFIALDPIVESDSSSDGAPLFCDFVYGASLTPINGSQAVRFGGFEAGGYSHESNQVAVLTIARGGTGNRLTATWKVIEARRSSSSNQLADQRGDVSHHSEKYLARAYHTATFMYDRYLLMLGGMQSSRSIWNPALLDTQTWTWILPCIDGCIFPAHPSPRHGHSTIWDAKRSRLVLFGGGSGNDLLRSGIDDTEVWTTTIDVSSPEALVGAVSGNAGPCHLAMSWQRLVTGLDTVSLSQSLCLGRCHVSHRIAPDMVLLAFGSGRPSTNGLLSFNLATNTFLTVRVRGPLPYPRLSTTSVLWDSYVFCHGGFSTQHSAPLGDVAMLDLAPSLRRNSNAFLLTASTAVVGHSPPVTDEQVMEFRQRNRRGFVEMGWNPLGDLANDRAERVVSILRSVFGEVRINEQILRRGGFPRGGGRDDMEESGDESTGDIMNLDAEDEE